MRLVQYAETGDQQQEKKADPNGKSALFTLRSPVPRSIPNPSTTLRLPRGHQFKIYADNYFTNFGVAVEVRDRNIGQYTGTIQNSRCHNAPLKVEK